MLAKKRGHSAFSELSRKLPKANYMIICTRQGQCILNMSISTTFN